MNGESASTTLDNALKQFRISIDKEIKYGQVLQESIARGDGGREVALAITKLQEAKMWLGQALGEIGHKLPEEYRDEANA